MAVSFLPVGNNSARVKPQETPQTWEQGNIDIIRYLDTANACLELIEKASLLYGFLFIIQ